MKLSATALAATVLTGSIWFGTEDSLMAVEQAIAQVSALEAAGPDALKNAITMRSGMADPFGLPSMLTVHGDTGVVAIRGSLVAGSSGFFRLFGVLGYEDIKEAINAALEDKNVKRIVLDIGSGGGQVDGVIDAGNFIRAASKIKPVISYAGGAMGSAAYWLGVSANQVYSAQTSMVGSVGTLIVTMEVTAALEKEGRKAHVFRFGTHKAMGHPFEKLSAKGEEHFQYLADAAGKIFVDYAAERRGTTPEKFQKTMGEGRVFLGADALEVGLIDGVMSFDQLIANAKSLDKLSGTSNNPRQPSAHAQDTDMKLTALSKAVILAIAGGTAVEALGLSSEAANVEGSKPEAEDVTKLTADAAEIHGAFTVAKESAVTAAVAAAKAPLEKAVTDLNAKVALLESGAAGLNAKVTESVETAALAQGIVRNSIATMSVALGATDTSQALQGKALIDAHDALSEQFKKKFPSGAVAAVKPSTEVTKPVEAKAPPAEFLAGVAGFVKS